MIIRDGKRLDRINIGGNREVFRVYFNDRVVFKRFHPVTAIVSTSNKQYIDSEMKNFWVDDMDFEITYANNWNSSCIWGCRPDKSYQEFCIINGNDQRITIRKGGSAVNGTAPNWYQSTADTKPRFAYNLLECQRGDSSDLAPFDITKVKTVKKVKDKVYLNDTLLGYTNSSSCQDFFLIHLPPYFFRLNQKDYELDGSGINSYNDNGVKYLYRATFYYKDKLYRDFIPVLDKNNVPALYEKVTKKFHYSMTNTPLEYFNGNFSQISCVYGGNFTNYVDTGIQVKDVGKWKLRLQSHNGSIASTTTNLGMGASELYFTRYAIDKTSYFYEIHIGSQVIQTDIPYISDSEILLTIDLINNKVTIEKNQQEKLTNQQTQIFNINPVELTSALTLTLGKINGTSSVGEQNFRIYYSEIYDKDDNLIQRLKPRINIATGTACMYDELSRTPYIDGKLSFI